MRECLTLRSRAERRGRPRLLGALPLIGLLLTTVGATTAAQPRLAAPPTAPISEAFVRVGGHDLGARGMHGGFAVADDCGYVGARDDHGPLILDLGDPTSPTVVGELPARPGATPRELRANAELGILVVLSYRLDPFAAAPNALDLYDVSDCRAPKLVGRFDFGDSRPHEFFLWRDPAPERRRRLLAYVAMWGDAPNLRVIDLSRPATPTEIATWDAGATLGVPSRLHSLTVSADGRRAYLADWDAGLLVLDVSALAAAEPAATITSLTPAAAALLLPGGNLHSAVPVPLTGRELVVTTQEIYGPGACPYGRLHLVDVATPAAPTIVGAIGLAENDPAACAATEALDGVFTSHTPTVVGDLAFVSWYAGGLRAVDLSVPTAPRLVGAFVPEPLPAVATDDPTLGGYPVRVWSSPIVKDGLIYVVDIRNGLSILRYTGAGSDAVSEVALAEGNATR